MMLVDSNNMLKNSNLSKLAREISHGKRFEFGKNWSGFLALMNEERIIGAEESLKQMLEVDDLKGKSFLDIGSGSGLFSLAARRLGARVHSFDYDPQSVACTAELKHRFFPDDANWVVEDGSVLDEHYSGYLGKFDIVYSWGVFHHTGAMWQALENASQTVVGGGKLFIAIYNDQGWISSYWKLVKKYYNKNVFYRLAIVLVHMPYLFVAQFFVRILSKRLKSDRGMSLWYDMIDWLGGYPFEVAKPEQIFDFYRQKGFLLTRLKTCGGRHGCNEFVFEKMGNIQQ